MLQGPEDVEVEKIHDSSKAIEHLLGSQLWDIVPAYDSIALFTTLEVREVIHQLKKGAPSSTTSTIPSDTIVVPICYELGDDLDYLSSHCNLSTEEMIARHLAGMYRAIFIGFTPGFIYADGLDSKLACPRKANPRIHIPAGSIGIGGEQTGIYSLDSPGGWNIIGRTPQRLFDLEKKPPMTITVGTQFRFERITKAQFEEWES